MLNARRYLFFYVFLLTFAPIVFSLGGKEKNKEPLAVIQVTGIVRLTGNANFPELIISDSEKSWVVVKEEMDKLHDLQYRTVTVEGEETVTELYFANGLSAGLRRELRNIKLIAILQ
ncbi:hypothetical protein R84B8_01726 [Treponema sp. R8-4-B8]